MIRAPKGIKPHIFEVRDTPLLIVKTRMQYIKMAYGQPESRHEKIIAFLTHLIIIASWMGKQAGIAFHYIRHTYRPRAHGPGRWIGIVILQHLHAVRLTPVLMVR